MTHPTLSRRLLLAPAVLVLAVSGLTACGGDDEPSAEQTSASTTEVEPIDGPTIEGDGFTVRVPEGWEEKDGSELPAYNFLALAVSSEEADGFSDNINVLEDPTIVDVESNEELDAALEKVLAGVSEEAESGPTFDVDGVTASTIQARYTTPANYVTHQYAFVHEDKGYVVTISFGSGRKEAERTELADSIMASWSWQ